jgi:hypothetical protein
MALTDLGPGNTGQFGRNVVLSVSYEFLGSLFRPHRKVTQRQGSTGGGRQSASTGPKRRLYGPDPRDMDYLRDIDGL